MNSSISEPRFGRRFDRKACTRIKGHTIQRKDLSKSAIHLPGRSQASTCNIGATEGRGEPEGGRLAWHPHTHCHVFDPRARSCTQVSLSRGLDVSLIEWTERLAHGSKDPPLSAKACPCHQSNSLGDHKHPLAMTVQRRAKESQREADRPPLGWPA